MCKKSIAINGQFTVRRMTGQERFAYEIVCQLDNIVEKSVFNIELVVPANAVNIPDLRNIKVVKYGKAKGSLWEQTYFAFYLMTHRRISLNMCSVMPLLKPGIICIHDLSYKVNPHYFTTFYAKMSQLWHKIQFHTAWRFSPIVFTVSEYSKQQMMTIYNVSANRIVVLGNGWEHFLRIPNDDTLIECKPELFVKPYFFSLGSLAPNKNIGWILEVANKHPQYNFYLAGNLSLKSYGVDYEAYGCENVHFLGYISDAEIKLLMRKCKAFIFPSYFEGFGIPPLEALSVGTKIIVSNSTCLPEIFGNAAYYIDPYDTNIDIDELLSKDIGDAKRVLDKYRFERYSSILLEAIEKNV